MGCYEYRPEARVLICKTDLTQQVIAMSEELEAFEALLTKYSNFIRTWERRELHRRADYCEDLVVMKANIIKAFNTRAEGWVSVKTEKPEGRCLVFIPDERGLKIHTAEYHENITIIAGHFGFDRAPVTHWMPLPAPPTE